MERFCGHPSRWDSQLSNLTLAQKLSSFLPTGFSYELFCFQIEWIKSPGFLKGAIEGGALSSTKKLLLEQVT